MDPWVRDKTLDDLVQRAQGSSMFYILPGNFCVELFVLPIMKNMNTGASLNVIIFKTFMKFQWQVFIYIWSNGSVQTLDGIVLIHR